jgi:hypothetical protein
MSSHAFYLNAAIFGFVFSFVMAPFSALGYIFVFTMVATEIFYHITCSEAQCFPTRMFIILLTVFGRLLGEFFWNLVVYHTCQICYE